MVRTREVESVVFIHYLASTTPFAQLRHPLFARALVMHGTVLALQSTYLLSLHDDVVVQMTSPTCSTTSGSFPGSRQSLETRHRPSCTGAKESSGAKEREMSSHVRCEVESPGDFNCASPGDQCKACRLAVLFPPYALGKCWECETK